jgi:hypothetical protein
LWKSYDSESLDLEFSVPPVTNTDPLMQVDHAFRPLSLVYLSVLGRRLWKSHDSEGLCTVLPDPYGSKQRLRCSSQMWASVISDLSNSSPPSEIKEII